MRPAARLLLVEAEALPRVLSEAPDGFQDQPTVCTGWSVRDVLAHCAAVLTAAAEGAARSYTPEENQRDVVARRSVPFDDVVAELLAGYAAAADAIDRAEGGLDGVGLGEWMHGGDVRDAIGAARPYTSEGVELAVPLLVERSLAAGAPHIDVVVDGRRLEFGRGVGSATAKTDLESFVRLCGGRRPDPTRYRLDGVAAGDFVLFG